MRINTNVVLAGILACVPLFPQHCDADQPKLAPVTYATHNIKAGSIIRAIDVEKKMIPDGRIPGKSIPSPLLAVGFRAVNDMPANIIIMSHDIDFTGKLPSRECTIASEEIAKGIKKWTSPSDIRWFRSCLIDRAPFIQRQYRALHE